MVSDGLGAFLLPDDGSTQAMFDALSQEEKLHVALSGTPSDMTYLANVPDLPTEAMMAIATNPDPQARCSILALRKIPEAVIAAALARYPLDAPGFSAHWSAPGLLMESAPLGHLLESMLYGYFEEAGTATAHQDVIWRLWHEVMRVRDETLTLGQALWIASQLNSPNPPKETGDPIQDFWARACRFAPGSDLEAHLGTLGEAVAPRTRSFGETPELADDQLASVLDGSKTATSGLESEYVDANEPLPRPGDLAIVVDGTGAPRALIRTEEVAVVPFGEITAMQVTAEGEWDRTLDSWRAEHRSAWETDGHVVDDATPVVLERFKVVFPVSAIDRLTSCALPAQ